MTSATTWCLYTLAKNPRAQQKMYQEIREAKDQAGGELSPEQIAKMPYVKAVVKETLRKYPITYSTSRYIDNDLEIAGYQIPAGVRLRSSFVCLCVYRPVTRSVLQSSDPPPTNRTSLNKMKEITVYWPCKNVTFALLSPLKSFLINLNSHVKHLFLTSQSHVQANLYGMYHNADLFYQPEEFIPERWLKSGQQMDPVVKSLSQLIWGHGARMCIGQ